MNPKQLPQEATNRVGATSQLRDRIVRGAFALRDPSTAKLAYASLFPGSILGPALPLETTVPDTAISDLEFGGSPQPRVGDIIFQTWKSKSTVPPNYVYWRSTFKALHPTWKHVLSDDADNRNLVQTRFDFVLPAYQQYPREIFRVDLVRLLFLFSFGGVYADLDTECISPLSDLANLDGVILGEMGHDKKFEHSIPNAIMCSSPNQLFWLVALSLALRRQKSVTASSSPEWFTGPILIRDAVMTYRSATERELRQRCAEDLPEWLVAKSTAGELRVLPPRAFYPLNWNNPGHRQLRKRILEERKVLTREAATKLFAKSTLVTYWSHSW